MTTIQTRTEEIYAELKLVDRMTPGRTPWQTLRKRAEDFAASEMLTEDDRLPLMDANSANPLEASIARLRAEVRQMPRDMTYGEAVQDLSTALGRAYADAKTQRETVIGQWMALGYTREEAYKAALFGFRKGNR